MTLINPFLNGDMCDCFKLKITFFLMIAIVTIECPLDIDGVGVVPLYEIAVVTIHRSYEF